jgi:hypothetical protein
MAGTDDQLGRILGRGSATRRLADALLRSLGTTQITLRIADPSSGDTGSQLGLEPAHSEDIQISPALIRALPAAAGGERNFEVMLSASALKVIAGKYGVEDVVSWLRAAQGVLFHGQLLHIDSANADKYFGSDCLYRLTVTE